MKNRGRYLAPEGYYEITKDKGARHILSRALRLVEDPAHKTALDLGCGSGRETGVLLDYGFSVLALDANPESEEFIRALPHQDRLEFKCAFFEEFQFPENYFDFINAGYALPFTEREYFDSVMSAIRKSLKPGGVLCCQLFGDHDEWNNAKQSMTFLSAEQAKHSLGDLQVVEFAEKEEDGHLANGSTKYWHTFDIIAQNSLL